MRHRGKGKMRRLAVPAQHPIRALVRPVGHVIGWEVRQPGQGLVDLGAQPHAICCSLRFGFSVFDALTQQRLDRLAAFLGGPDLPGETVAPGLCFLRAGLSSAPRTIECENLLCMRRQPAASKTTVEFLRVLADPSEIVHNATGYKAPAGARPSAVSSSAGGRLRLSGEFSLLFRL